MADGPHEPLDTHCRSCGEPFDEGDEFCSKCGGKRTGGAPPEVATASSAQAAAASRSGPSSPGKAGGGKSIRIGFAILAAAVIPVEADTLE